MKAKQRNSENVPLKVNDHNKPLKDYDLRISTWNVRTLCRVCASSKLADAVNMANAIGRTWVRKASIMQYIVQLP